MGTAFVFKDSSFESWNFSIHGISKMIPKMMIVILAALLIAVEAKSGQDLIGERLKGFHDHFTSQAKVITDAGINTENIMNSLSTQLKSLLQDALKEIDGLEGENERLTKENNVLKEENKNLTKKNGELKTENGELETENGELKTVNGDLKTENGDLKTKNGDLKTELAKCKKDYEALKKLCYDSLKECQDKIKYLGEELVKCKKDLKTCRDTRPR